MPQIPIPTDWDGVSWRCIQIEWPDSDQYIGILHGLLSYPMRGRLYDANTGSILDAQAIGQLIWNRNTPLTDCAGDIIHNGSTPESATSGAGGSQCEEYEEWLMPCIDISNLLKIEGGVLYARDSCCEWIAVGNLTTQTAPIPDPYYDPESPATYYPCGRAAAVVDLMYAVAHACWDAIGTNPLTWVGQVKAAAPGYHLSDTAIMTAIAYGVAANVLWSEGEVFSAAMQQRAKCQLEGLFSADGLALSLDDFKGLKSAIKAMWSAEASAKLAIGVFFVAALDALGHTDVSNASVLGATDSAADCTCPESLTPPPFGEEELYYDVIANMTSVTATCPLGNPVKTFVATVTAASQIRGAGETTTSSNQTCDFDEIDAPGVEILAGDEVWILPTIYSKGPSTNFNVQMGFTQHREGGDYEALALFGDADEIEALPNQWARLLTFGGEPSTLTRVYGGFKWWADGENIDFKISGLIVRRP